MLRISIPEVATSELGESSGHGQDSSRLPCCRSLQIEVVRIYAKMRYNALKCATSGDFCF